MIELYLLDQYKAPYVARYKDWQRWFEDSGGSTTLSLHKMNLKSCTDQLTISTAFIGFYNHEEEADIPRVFETTLSIGKFVKIISNYPTWLEAMVNHKRFVRIIQHHKERIDSSFRSTASKLDAFTDICQNIVSTQDG